MLVVRERFTQSRVDRQALPARIQMTTLLGASVPLPVKGKAAKSLK
jgi:hypothetical protein